jgi:hypothetical protein
MPYITFGLCHRKPSPPPKKNEDEATRLNVEVAKENPIDPKRARAVLERYEHLMKSFEKQTIHGMRSLDQFVYNSLHDIDDRDQNQVFTRSFYRSQNGDGVPENRLSWPFIAVDQLWLWVIDEGNLISNPETKHGANGPLFCLETILTSSTHRKDDCDNAVFERILRQLRQTIAKEQPSSVKDLSRFIVALCVDFLHSLKWEDFSSFRQPSSTDPKEEDTLSSMPVHLLFQERINLAVSSNTMATLRHRPAVFLFLYLLSLEKNFSVHIADCCWM